MAKCDGKSTMRILSLVLVLFSQGWAQDQTTTISSFRLANETTTSMNCSDPSNELNPQCINLILQGQSSLVQIILVSAVTGIWIIYLSFYNSRFVGLIITKVANKFIKDSYLHIGSFSVSVLSGKLMFRNVKYLTKNYSIRINDGYLIFRWWRPYKFTHWPKQHELSHGHTRLSVVLFGLEWHMYNNIKEYERIQELYKPTNQKKELSSSKKVQKKDSNEIDSWRNLFPVIKFLIYNGKVVIGNRLLPNTCVAAFSEGELQYKTTEASNPHDLFLHAIEGVFKSATVSLIPSLNFDAAVTPAMLIVSEDAKEPPPRKMGDGYKVVDSNTVTLKYFWDEPGLVPLLSKSSTLDESDAFADRGDEKLITDDPEENFPAKYGKDDGPMYEVIVHFGKHTTFNYGPWADRQRDIIYRFFYPSTYQDFEATEPPKPGDRRTPRNLKFSALFDNGADLDLLYTKVGGIGAMQINTAVGSFVEGTIPMTVDENGFTSHVSGQLLHPDVSTSLHFRNFLKAETFGFDLKMHLPRKWNGHQTWDLKLAVSKASLQFVFAHKDFFSEIAYDWSNKSPLDFMFFIPYNINLDVQLDEFELCLPLNKHNWIDCQSNPKENAYLALYGSSFSSKFVIPSEVFLPSLTSIPFDFQAKRAQIYAYLPESNMTRNNLLNLANHQKKWNQPSNVGDGFVEWDRLAKKNWGMIRSGWVVVAEISSVCLNLTYTWHPIITPHKSPSKIKLQQSRSIETWRSGSSSLRYDKKQSPKPKGKVTVTFDPHSLVPDVLKLDLSIPSGAVLVLYGSIVDLVVAFKDNYLGYDDVYTDFALHQQKDVELKKSSSHGNVDNYLYFRPLDVAVNVNIQDICAILPIHYCNLYTSQPKVKLKQLLFEMGKNFLQTRMQFLLDRLEILVTEMVSSVPELVKMDCCGRLHLQDLQLRGHAMFSSAGLSMGTLSVEYAWLMEVLIGDIKGLLSFIHLQALLDWLNNFAFLSSNEASQLEKAFPHRRLPTGITWNYKKLDGSDVEEMDVKYQMTRIRFHSVHLRFAQDQTIFDFRVSPITLANGNIQEEGVEEAWSVAVKDVNLKHYILKPNDSGEWLEAGEVRMGPIITQVSVATKESNMSAMKEEFLKFHDRKTRRLLFLWDPRVTDGKVTKSSPLWDSVKGLKSWGCSFFAPVVERQPTMYYDEQDSKLGRFTSVRATEEEGLLMEEEEEDVFDPMMDYGMSILVEGKPLVERAMFARSEKVASPHSVTPEASSLSSIPAGEILMHLETSTSSAIANKSLSAPSNTSLDVKGSGGSSGSQRSIPLSLDQLLHSSVDVGDDQVGDFTLSKASDVTAQARISTITVGHATSSETSDSSKLSPVSSVIGGKDSTVGSDRSTELPVSKSSSAISKETMKSEESPTPSQSYRASVNRNKALPGSPGKWKMKLASSLNELNKASSVATSDETYIFLSAESNLQESSSDSSDSEDFYSAESDLENFASKPIKPVASVPDIDGGSEPENMSKKQDALLRPGNLEFHRPRNVVRKLELSTEQLSKSSTSLNLYPRKLSLKSSSRNFESFTEITSCYGYLLSTAKFKDSNWLSDFDIVQDGVHPSAVIEKPGEKSNQKRATDDIFKRNPGENCTNVVLHIKGGVDIQTSPFLLDSVQHVLDAIAATAHARHPSSVLSHMQAKCTSDAMADFHFNKLNNQDAIGGVLASAFGQMEGSKTKLKVFMDLVRVNVIQATPGDEPVFNLRLNKMLPSPCLTIATIRLDRMDISGQLNSKKDKLLSKARTKAGLSQSFETDASEEELASSSHGPLVLLSARGSVNSLACQMRVLSQNGCAPERSNVSALGDENCRSPFKFDSSILLPRVKDALENYEDLQRCPPKPWGWVMFEAGINSVSAEVVKRDRPVAGSLGRHESEGQLNIGLVWLNAVAPQSPSQVSKANRAFRSWNLLTALAPSCCAWLASVDRVMCSSQRLGIALQNRYFTTVAAALTLASKDPGDKQALRVSSMSKYNMFTELSKAIKNDPSCILCNALQLHFSDEDNYHNLEAAILEERNLPANLTLEMSIQIILGLLLDSPAQPNKKKSRTGRQNSTVYDATPSSQQNRSPAIAVKYGGALELSTFLKEKSPSEKERETGSLLPPRNYTVTTTALQNFENVVQEQQKSLYSWMQQNQRTEDVEAQIDRNPNLPTTSQTLLPDSLIRKANITYYSFLTNVGIANISRGSANSNVIQSVFGGGLLVKAAIGSIKMEKQNPDRVYTKDNRRRKKPSWKHRFTPSIETPIIVCQNLELNVSLIDTLVDSPTQEKLVREDSPEMTESNNTNNNNNNMNKMMDRAAMKKFLTNRSKLSGDIHCSVGLVKQRIDIALVRLIHQFFMCGKYIQQAMTDIQVNKYTAGALSPEILTGHRRGFSNISATMFGSTMFADSANAHSSKRRFTLPATPFTHGDDSDTSSEESFSASPCWQEVYRLVDMYRPENTDGQTAGRDFVKMETEQSMAGYTTSFVSLDLKATINLEEVQFLAEIGDLLGSIRLVSLSGAAKHVRTAVSAFKYEAELDVDASLQAINAEVTDRIAHNRTSFLQSHVGLCHFEAKTNQNCESSSENKCSLLIGKIVVELPQRPSTMHDVVYRSSKRINVHFQEFAVATPSVKAASDVVDGLPRSASPSATTFAHLATPATPSLFHSPTLFPGATSVADTASILPLTISFELTLEGIELGANMLPSSIVRYTTEAITGKGILGKDSSFIIELPTHAINFSSSALPSIEGHTSTSIPLPRIGAEGEMKQNHVFESGDDHALQMKEGDYLSVSVDVGGFEHTLTTDLFNQFKYVQDVLIEEIDHILVKISTDKGAATALSETSIKSGASSHAGSHTGSKLLYQLQLRLDSIQLTAVTPSKNAVRLKTGTMTFELSNRVVRAGQKSQYMPKYLKIFGKAQVDISLGLGTLIENNVYPELEPEFQQFAYFTTTVGLQNTTQIQERVTLKPSAGHEASGKVGSEDNSVILINLTRPIFFVQPTAFDKAILFFLVYKNAYDEWTEKRETVHMSGSKTTASQMLSAFQNRPNRLHTAEPNRPGTSSLFLQLCVKDLGICLPVIRANKTHEPLATSDELSSALVLTIDNTMISACYARALVSTGQFRGFCLRFTDDFQPSWDDWAPKNYLANSFVVPDGTYQICTDTTSYQGPQMRARTSVNVVWKMKGMDVKLDTKIGSYLTTLVDTMTLITGNQARRTSESDKFEDSTTMDELDGLQSDEFDGTPKRVKKPSKTPTKSKNKEQNLKEKSRKLEYQYNEQVRLIGDLRSLGAKHSTIEEQESRLHEIEAELGSVVRKTFRNKLRRSSMRTGSFTDHQASHPSHKRSISSGFARAFSPIKPVQSVFATLPSLKKQSSSGFRSALPPFHNTSAPESSDGISDDDLSDDEAQDDVIDGVEINVTPNEQTAFSPTPLQNESVELELILDVRVGIDGGKIVCQPAKEEEAFFNVSTTSGSSRFNTMKAFESNETVFYVPGVSIKCRYNSVAGDLIAQEDSAAGVRLDVPPKIPVVEVETPGGSVLRKRSSVYIWFSLQSLPEMIISPCFLDFLEQTLQAIPIAPVPEPIHPEEGIGAVESLDSTIAALPMDTFVFVSIQPSQVLFNCLPMSRVECLLNIPSLDATFSNIRHSTDTQATTFVFPEKASSSTKQTEESNLKTFPGGLAITVIMSDFSIYLFHPYGTQVSHSEQKSGSGRKDSLSVDLEVVRINIVRTTKGSPQVDASFQIKDKAFIVNMSTLIDIGKASFKYDMRRLSEILAFPRAWYRRSIARRLFLGDTTERRQSVNLLITDSPTSEKRSVTTVETVHSNVKDDWVSIVLYCLKMSHLEVQMNMSNVMGNTLWSCDGLTSQGKLAMQSAGDQDLFLSCNLKNSQLSARGGIIGGNIELKQLYANCRLLEPSATEPRHKLFVMMHSLDGRIEYMGGCIMMGKLTKVVLKLSDEWKGPKLSIPTNLEKSSIFVPGDFKWDNFSLAISRSTTPDVIKMLAKLEEFFTQQFQNSVRALSSLRLSDHRSVAAAKPPSVPPTAVVYAFHRHWPSVYQTLRSLGISPNFLLGGSFCLHGNHLTIVCFHGNNFRSRTWLLFNILEPNIMFSTEVQEIKESMSGDEASTLSIQSLTFNLGHDYWLKTSTSSSDPMATVSRVTRSRHENAPPSSATIDEWFAYITASHTQELTMLRTLNDISGNATDRKWSPAGGAPRNKSASSYSHDTDIIFALPKLQLDFRTEHMQGTKEPDPKQKDKPVVDCSFVTEFTDHICVTMDVELMMCLHDIISSYLKEKQKAFPSRGSRAEHTVVDAIDLRQFICNTWQLEPTVRLISWAGRRIEPVGVDYILQQLGFRHARTTIPKWFQRGVLDVLDQALAVIVQNLVVVMHQRKKI